MLKKVLNYVQLAILVFFSKRIHDCGLSGWIGAAAKAFGWTMLASMLSGVLTLAAFLALLFARKFLRLRSVTITKPGTLELTEPYEAAWKFGFLTFQVLLLLWFTRCG